MIVVKKGANSYQYSGNFQDLIEEYIIPEGCITTIQVQEYSDCQAEVLGLTSLPSLDI